MVTGSVTLGKTRHEQAGADFLASLGLPEQVTVFAGGHVDAKRYLCAKNPQYVQSERKDNWNFSLFVVCFFVSVCVRACASACVCLCVCVCLCIDETT